MEWNELYSPVTEGLLKKEKHTFVGYLTAGYPDRESFFRIVRCCEEAGLSIFEIGFPSEDPYADGEIIRRAHQLTDKSIAGDLEFWRRLRRTIQAPIWLMGYEADLVRSGAYRKLAEERLIDGLVLPDCSNEQRRTIAGQVAEFGVDVLGFICPPPSDGKETAVEAHHEKNLFTMHNFGVIYHQLYSGPTGIANTSEDYLELLAEAKRESGAYLFAGFGIGTAQRAEELLNHGYDGVIIGTAIMKRLAQSEEALYAFVRELADTVRSVE